MRAGEVIGRHVRDSDGRLLGICTDMRCEIQQRAADAAPEIILRGLLVSPHRVGSLLGYERGRTRGPWLVRVLIARLHRGMVFVAWDDVQPVTGDEVQLRAGARVEPLRSTLKAT